MMRSSFVATAFAFQLAALTLLLPYALEAQASLSRGGISSEKSLTLFQIAQTSAQADSLFGSSGFETVSSVGFTFSGGEGAIYTEFLSDNMALTTLLGYGRIGFGAFVQAADSSVADSTTAAAADRFLAAGGNAQLYYTLPIATYGAGFNEGPETISAQLMFTPRLGFDVPALSAGTAEFDGNLDLGFTLGTQLRSHTGVFNLFATFRYGWVAWAGDEFLASLDRDEGFDYTLFEGGVVLRDFIRLSVRKAFAGPTSLTDDQPAMITVQLVPFRGGS